MNTKRHHSQVVLRTEVPSNSVRVQGSLAPPSQDTAQGCKQPVCMKIGSLVVQLWMAERHNGVLTCEAVSASLEAGCGLS